MFERKNWRIWTLLLLAISINQAAAYSMLFVWNFSLLHYLILVFFFSLVFSIAVKHLEGAFALMFSSFATGTLLFLFVLLIPPLTIDGSEIIGFVAEIYLIQIARVFAFAIPVNLFGVLLGYLLRELME